MSSASRSHPRCHTLAKFWITGKREIIPREGLPTTRELGESPGEIVGAHPFGSSLHSCRSNLSSKYSSAPTRSRRKSDGVKNLYRHLAQEAMEGTCSPYLRTMTKPRSAMAQSAATNRRSRCGSVRGSPVLSSHFSPGAAPQVGQRTASICLGLRTLFMLDR